MERKDVMAKNVTIYRDQASALAKYASKDVKVSVAPTHLPQSWPHMLHAPTPVHLLSPTVHTPTTTSTCTHTTRPLLPLPGACGRQPCQYQCAHPKGVRARRRPREHHMPYTARPQQGAGTGVGARRQGGKGHTSERRTAGHAWKRANAAYCMSSVCCVVVLVGRLCWLPGTC